MADKKPGGLLAAVQKASLHRETDVVAYAEEPSVSVVQPAKPKKTSSRSNTRLIAGHFDPVIAKQLRMLAAEEETTVQQLLAEALDLLFVKKGKAQIETLMKRSS